jgi:hypothetical protein
VADQSQGSEFGHGMELLLPRNTIGTVNVDFDRGTIVTNEERHNTDDSGFADFDALQFQYSGGSGCIDWISLKNVTHDDSVWHCIKISETHHKVKSQSRTCPLP